jgi:hypothetical protein
MCANCGHPTHIGRCTGDAPNAQFRCHCVGVPLTDEQRIQQLHHAFKMLYERGENAMKERSPIESNWQPHSAWTQMIASRVEQLEARQGKIFETIEILGQGKRSAEEKIGQLEFAQANNNAVHSQIEDRLEALEAVNPRAEFKEKRT